MVGKNKATRLQVAALLPRPQRHYTNARRHGCFVLLLLLIESRVCPAECRDTGLL